MTVTFSEVDTNTHADTEPTIVETLEEAQVIFEESPGAAILIGPRKQG